MQEKLINDKDKCFKSFDLATIVKDVKLDFKLEDCKYTGINNLKLKSILEELEFKSLLNKYDLNGEVSNNKVVRDNSFEIKDINDIDYNKDFSFYIESKGEVYSKSDILGIGFYDYIECSEACASIEIEVIPKKKKYSL